MRPCSHYENFLAISSPLFWGQVTPNPVCLTKPPRSRRSSSQPQVFVVVLQVGPRRLVAQSALVRHSTQNPVVVLHTPSWQFPLVVHLGRDPQWATGPAPTPPGMQVGPAGLPAQSELVTQKTQKPVDVLQTVP
jgi:hypothetical protein